MSGILSKVLEKSIFMRSTRVDLITIDFLMIVIDYYHPKILLGHYLTQANY